MQVANKRLEMSILKLLKILKEIIKYGIYKTPKALAFGVLWFVDGLKTNGFSCHVMLY